MGILAMIAGLFLLILIHEAGHWLAARAFGFKTPVFSIGFGPRKYSIVLGKFWDTEFRLSPIPLGGYVSIPELGDETTARGVLKENGEDPASFKKFAIWKRVVVAAAGVTMNVLFALVVLFATFATLGQPTAAVRDVFVQETSTQITIAKDAGLQPHDIFVSVAGQKVNVPQDITAALQAHKSEPIDVVVTRGNAQETLHLTPNADGKIGVVIGVDQDITYNRLGVVDAASASASTTGMALKNMFVGIGMMLHIVPAPAGADTTVHGVVGIVQIGASAFSAGLFNFIWILVMISLNLAVMNILPIPLLDGGHIMFMGVEKLRGKPLTAETQGKISYLFFLLLIMLMLTGLFNDITHPIGK